MNFKRTKTAVSHIIRDFEENRDSGAPVDDAANRFTVLVASDRETRERACRLAYNVYRDRGLVSFNPRQMVISAYDATPHVLTLLSVDRETGEDAATMSIVLDENGLPSDEIYPEEIDRLRSGNRSCVEVTRLAIRKKFRNSRNLFVRMTNIISIFSRRVWHATDWVIEVNPRHARFYERFYLFEQTGQEKACSRVENAPAVLMRMDLGFQEDVIRKTAGQNSGADQICSRTLYRRYMRFEHETDIAELLRRQYKPMDAEHARYFGLRTSFTPHRAAH